MEWQWTDSEIVPMYPIYTLPMNECTQYKLNTWLSTVLWGRTDKMSIKVYLLEGKVSEISAQSMKSTISFTIQSYFDSPPPHSHIPYKEIFQSISKKINNLKNLFVRSVGKGCSLLLYMVICPIWFTRFKIWLLYNDILQSE